ncbi:hypothetical protein OIDMADRAFT_19254 [Oidiodendron maius Zn]|uniref:Uncharacterized protein n=1 Tax=Oidiodendron maius (strain Zn) TaxID=913774 RepID=A0A0C3HDY4_OIDMZ|nr:hypothetical protein OIDMADRAFT_19254 [Oidiodendron maius Zn]
MCENNNSSPGFKMTPFKGALFATTGPAGFFVYNKINHGSICPFHHKKNRKDHSTELSECSSAGSSSSSSKKRSKKELKKDKLELERELYGDVAARSTSSEVGLPAYSRR